MEGLLISVEKKMLQTCKLKTQTQLRISLCAVWLPNRRAIDVQLIYDKVVITSGPLW